MMVFNAKLIAQFMKFSKLNKKLKRMLNLAKSMYKWELVRGFKRWLGLQPQQASSNDFGLAINKYTRCVVSLGMPWAWEHPMLQIPTYLIHYYFTSPIYYTKLVSIDAVYIETYRRTEGQHRNSFPSLLLSAPFLKQWMQPILPFSLTLMPWIHKRNSLLL